MYALLILFKAEQSSAKLQWYPHSDTAETLACQLDLI